MGTREEQVEALRTLLQFNDRLISNMSTLESELTGSRKEDTDDYLNEIMNAMNWEISVIGSTLPVLNEGEERIDKIAFNEKVLEFNSAVMEKNEVKMARSLYALKKEFGEIGDAAKMVVNQ